jgi:small-conductance mechanosensitive channel/CRP-like cAMP-binding protein
MTDLLAVAKMIADDPLVEAFALMAVGVLVTRLLFKQHPIRRAIARVVFFVLLSVLLLHGGIVPYQPLHSSGAPLHDAVAGALKIAWWLWAAWFLVSFLRSVVVLERRPREGKLVQDLLSGIIYLAAIFAIIAYVFGLPIQGLLATSGAIAIILGLALQSTLNDVFSGLVLNFTRPYRPGDWIILDGGTEGQVIEMNWRATHVLTSQRDLAIVPNSTIAKSRIVNASFPSSIHGVTIAIKLEANTPPESGVRMLKLAVLNSRLILEVPRPSVRVLSIDAGHTGFEITFFVQQLGSATKAQNELFDLIFRHLAAAGMHLASPVEAPDGYLDEGTLKAEMTIAARVLDLVGIFDGLAPSERAAIAGKLKQASYEQGATLVEPGMVLQSLYIIGSGVLSVTRREGSVDTELLRLGPGDHFGEIGLLTGAPAGATIAALAPSIVYELPKNDLAPILQARPQITHELSRALAQRQAVGRAGATVERAPTESTMGLSAWFSDRLHRLFDPRDA